jgi:polysaccharide export outer membrane protein
LPVEKIGPDDLLSVGVYDTPALSGTLRVESDGNLRMPMIKQPIQAAGLYPAALEKEITTALIGEGLVLDPVVRVSVLEYRSRPITIVGAVRSPTTFQETGTLTLLDAISRAGGLSENAGAEILVSHQSSSGPSGQTSNLVQKIPVRALINGTDPSLNLRLQGGEEIRVPEAGRVFVMGNVKKPGAFPITDGGDSSVLKAMALCEGMNDFSGHIAYIYRPEVGAAGRSEIPIELKKIMDRKSPDVALQANDILYVPNATGRKASVKFLEASIGIAAGLAGTLIYIYH